jgi:hypothetical protein
LGTAEKSGNIETRRHQLPTHDGGIEVLSAAFLPPNAFISKFHNGELSLMPPQYYILKVLAEIFSSSQNENTKEQRDDVLTLAKGTFGRMLINPRALPKANPTADKVDEAKEQDKKDKSVVLTYEGDETRGGAKGRLHRVVMTAGKGGVSIFLLFSLS